VCDGLSSKCHIGCYQKGAYFETNEQICSLIYYQTSCYKMGSSPCGSTGAGRNAGFAFSGRGSNPLSRIPAPSLRVSQKGTLFLLGLLFISFAPPKEMNQRKGGRKRQPPPVCPPSTRDLNGSTKQGVVRTFSGLPSLPIDG
jgi:hypothetical protein